MSEALRAQERLHNAISKLDRLLENGVATTHSFIEEGAASEELELLKKENARLQNEREQVKLRIDTLIASIEQEAS